MRDGHNWQWPRKRPGQSENFLQRNALLNGGSVIAFEQVDWADKNDNLGLFDLIIGSDLLYEQGQAEALAKFIDLHARRTCEVIIVDPGRGQLSKFGRLMVARGYTDVQHKKSDVPREDEPPRVQTHSYFRS